MFDVVVGLVVLVAAPVLVIWWLPYLVHEIGHAVAAILVGARFDYIPLGPLVVSRVGGRPRLHWQIVRFACGAVLPTKVPARQLFIARLGGPVLNVVIGILLLGLGFRGEFDSAYLMPLALLLTGLFMTAHGAIWLLPWRPYGVPSDGRVLLSLLRPSPSSRRWIALQILTGLSQEGHRPRDWPAEALRALVTPSDGSIDDVSGALYLYCHLLDSGRLKDGRACLEQARAAASRQYMSERHSQLVLLELAYVEARVGDDPSIAVDHLLRSAFIARATLARVLSALQISYALFASAERTAEAGRRELGALRPGFAAMEKDLLAGLAREARDRAEGAARTDDELRPNGEGIDVALFAVPDVAVQVPRPPPGPRSMRAAVGFVSAAALGLVTYQLLADLAPSLIAVSVLPVVAAILVVVRVLGSRGRHRVGPLRQAFAALGVFLIASPILLTELLRSNSAGYIWFAGLQRPCLHLGATHDIGLLTMSGLSLGFVMLGLLLATRSHGEVLVPPRGILLGVGTVVLWIATITSDHAQLAAILGCAQ